MRYDPSRSILAGMDTTVLQTRLAAMQQAYLDLSTGAKGESYGYTQGDGAKNITYTKANIGQLTMAIRQVQVQLGIICAPRRPISFRF